MNYKRYCLASGTLFSLVALAHLVRALNAWPLQVGGFAIPMWISWAAIVVTGTLALFAFRIVRGSDG